MVSIVLGSWELVLCSSAVEILAQKRGTNTDAVTCAATNMLSISGNIALFPKVG